MSETQTKVKFQTTLGDFIIELDAEKAPITVKNFITYVEEGFFNGTIFHRIIPGFMAQGGGFDTSFAQKETHGMIKNEADNGLKNDRGTLAMARTPAPDSATAQFFINNKDNDFLNDGAGPAMAGVMLYLLKLLKAWTLLMKWQNKQRATKMAIKTSLQQTSL